MFFFLVLAVVSLLLHMAKIASPKRSCGRLTQQAAAIVSDRPVDKGQGPARAGFIKSSITWAILRPLPMPLPISSAVCVQRPAPAGARPADRSRPAEFRFPADRLRIAAGGPESARRAAAGCLDEIRKFPEITRIALAEIDPLPGSGGGNRIYFFSISGQAEMR